MHHPLQRGIALFNGGEFFAAHEELEDAWRAASGDEKLFLQGLTQLAVGFHHHSTGNVTGARSVLARALNNLADYPAQFLAINLEALRVEASAFLRALESNEPCPSVPRIRQEQGPPESAGQVR